MQHLKKFKVYPDNGLTAPFWTTGTSKYAVQRAYSNMVIVLTEEEVKGAEAYRAKVAAGEIVENFID